MMRHLTKLTILIGLLGALWAPGPARAQASLYDQIVSGKIVGFGIHAGAIQYYNSAAPTSASAEVKDFTDILPSSYQGDVIAAQVLYERFILNFGATSASIRGIHQTNAATGFFTAAAQRDATQAAISWLYRPFSFGLGTESGTMRFDGPTGHRTFAFDHTYALLEFYIPLVSSKKVEPLIAFSYALPLDFGTGSTRAQTFFAGAAFATLGVVF